MQPEGESRSAHEDLNLFTSFDALIVFVSTVSFTALGTLLAGAYSPVCALGGGTGCALLFIHRYRRSFDWRMSAATLTSVLLLLCLALAFRLPAYRYEVGGQDQGTYWNMSRHFDRSGALPYIDKTREKIKNDPELLSIYDSNCHSSWHLADKFYFHVPGLFIDRLEQSRYTFQFYHLHPLWMSISGWIFGTENRAGSSVFFSILAIACWVLCFLELGGLPSRAVLLGACLAVHPLLSFFAKLPVSESTAGAFFAAALYYLLRFRRQAQRGVVVQGYLWISLLCVAQFCLTRITGFLLLPCTVLLYAAAKIGRPAEQKTLLARYAMIATALYFLSALYGLLYSPQYFVYIMEAQFERFGLAAEWQMAFIGASALLAFVFAAGEASGVRLSTNIVSRLVRRFYLSQPFFFAVLLLYACVRTGYGAWTAPADLSQDVRFVFLAYTGPLIAIILPFLYRTLRAQFQNTASELPPSGCALFAVLNIVAAIYLLSGMKIGYHYYYARYLSSELIPLAFVAAFYAFSRCCPRGWIAAGYAAVFSSFCLWVWLSALHQQSTEAARSENTLDIAADAVKQNGVVVLVRNGLIFDQELLFGLSVSRNLNVFCAATLEQAAELIPNLKRKFTDIALLAPHSTGGSSLPEPQEITYQQGTYGYWRTVGNISYRTQFFPRIFRFMEQKLFLYRLGSREHGPNTAEKPLKLGLMTELSGPGAQVGKACQFGFELARREFSPHDRLNDYHLHFIYEDTQGLTAPGVSAARKLIDLDKVDALLLKRSAIGMPVSPIAQRAGVALLGLVGPAAFTKENPLAFRFYPASAALGAKLGELAARVGKRKAAVVSTEDEWQLSIKEAFVAAFRQRGGALSFAAEVPASDTDFAGVISRMKQTAFDALIVNLGPAQTGVFIKKARELGVGQQIFGNYYTQEPAEIIQAGIDAVEGAFVVDIPMEKMRAFSSALAQAFPEAPGNSTAFVCYTGLALVLQTLAREGGIEGRAALAQALLRTEKIELADGALSVQNREIQYSLGEYVIRQGKMTPLE